MRSTANPETLLTVVRAISAEPGLDGPSEEELLAWSGYDWSRVLLHLPVDARSFLGRLERSWDTVIDDIERWCGGFRARPEPFQERFEPVFGYLGLLLVTLVSLRHSDAIRYPPQRGARSTAKQPRISHDCASICVPMLEEAAVRGAIRTIYAPDAWIPDQDLAEVEPDASSRAEWNRVDFDSLRFHRHGTTSFILAGQPAEAAQGRRRPLALKCLVYPYLRIPTIVRATREYLKQHGVPSRDLRHLVRVWASGASWILMDFVPGRTLAEHLGQQLDGAAPAAGRTARPPRRSAAPERELRIDLLAELGRELFAAMADLERAGLRHCDLSPSNIILTGDEDGGSPSFVLVDLGVNYLYTHAVPGLEGPDATYVAPEIRAGGTATARTDLYSVGQLLVAISGTPGASDGSVPDPFYAETPVMARFLEDLVDSDPDHRLLIFRPDATRPLYPQLRVFFDEELLAMTAARAERAGARGPRWLTGLLDLFTPLAGAPGRQMRMWRVRRSQGLYREPRRGMHVRWLLFWSWLSAAAWYLAITILITWWLRDLGWDWGNQVIAFLQQATGSPPDRFPYLDTLRAADYPIPDLSGNLPVRMVGMSFLLVGARYYQNLFAGLTPLIAGLRQGRLSLLAVLAEAHMRLFSVMAFVLVLPPTLVQRRWWPIFTAVGVLFVFFCNWTCLAFARLALRRAGTRRLSTVPAGRIAGLEAFSDWTPSAAFYAAATWTIGPLIYLDLVKDVYVYAGAVTAINTLLFYVIKCSGNSAADVRIGLGRAFLAAERLRYASGPRLPAQSAAVS